MSIYLLVYVVVVSLRCCAQSADNVKSISQRMAKVLKYMGKYSRRCLLVFKSHMGKFKGLKKKKIDFFLKESKTMWEGMKRSCYNVFFNELIHIFVEPLYEVLFFMKEI